VYTRVRVEGAHLLSSPCTLKHLRKRSCEPSCGGAQLRVPLQAALHQCKPRLAVLVGHVAVGVCLAFSHRDGEVGIIPLEGSSCSRGLGVAAHQAEEHSPSTVQIQPLNGILQLLRGEDRWQCSYSYSS
jgi:hypothetical protein